MKLDYFLVLISVHLTENRLNINLKKFKYFIFGHKKHLLKIICFNFFIKRSSTIQYTQLMTV